MTGRDASEVGGGTKPLRHLEEQLQEMEDSFSEVSSDDETGQLDLCLGKGSQNVSLQLRAAVGGGTGARLWTGGILLAEWLLHATKDGLRLKGKQVLELGAGAAALPSIVAARYGGAKNVLATDGLEEVVEQMRQNVAQNAPLVQCSLLPWLTAGRRRYPKKEQFDIVLFADGIYTERGALLLADAVTALLRPKGLLIGALPDLRAGIASFEEDLQMRGMVAAQVTLKKEVIEAASRPYDEDPYGLVAGGSAKEYRVMLWRYAQQVKTSPPTVSCDVSARKKGSVRCAAGDTDYMGREETTSDMKPVVPKAAGMEALGELPEGESSNSLKRTLVWPRGYALCIFSENHAVRHPFLRGSDPGRSF